MMAANRQSLGQTAALPRRLVRANDPVALVASAVGSTVAVAWTLGGAGVLLRRAFGGFAESPSFAMPWVAAVAGLTIVAIGDASRAVGVVTPQASTVARVGTVLAVLAFVPVGTSAAGLAAAVLPVGMALAVALVPILGKFRGTSPRRPFFGGDASGRSRRGDDPLPRPLGGPSPIGFRQRLERFHTPTEGDRAIGRVIVDVPSGSRTGHSHIGFCPPFAAVPMIEVTSDDDGIEAVVSAAEIVPWGVRVECRLSEPAEESLAIPVDVVARYPG